MKSVFIQMRQSKHVPECAKSDFLVKVDALDREFSKLNELMDLYPNQPPISGSNDEKQRASFISKLYENVIRLNEYVEHQNSNHKVERCACTKLSGRLDR